jgi:hypothetical protein
MAVPSYRFIVSIQYLFIQFILLFKVQLVSGPRLELGARIYVCILLCHEGVTKSSRTGRLERELQMV